MPVAEQGGEIGIALPVVDRAWGLVEPAICRSPAAGTTTTATTCFQSINSVHCT